MSNESISKDEKIFYPPKALSEKAYIKSMEEYEELYKQSIEDPEAFWTKQAEENLAWFKKWDKLMWYDFSRIGEVDEPYTKWFEGAKLNVAYNCLDRHIESGKKDKIAILWQGEKDEERKTYTYGELHAEVCRFSNVLKKHGVGKGDKVTLYMPMIPELPIAVLACARIGAVHSVVFSAFSSDSLATRVTDSSSKMIITSDVSLHAGKVSDLKSKVDEAVAQCDCVDKVIVYNRGNTTPEMVSGRDYWWQEEMSADDIDDTCEPEQMDAEDPLFILYTSGTTGKPKGVVHTTAGYLLHVTLTFKYIFDVHDDDIFWCTADIGWITGHSYIVYGPLSNGATEVMFEGLQDHHILYRSNGHSRPDATG